MLKPLQLYRRWRSAAGWDFGFFVPSAPFSELGRIYEFLSINNLTPRADVLGMAIAAALSGSEIGQAVREGQAAFVLDLPGFISVSAGAYLQTEGIAPILLMSACYMPGAFLDGSATLANLVYYGENLGEFSGEKGFAFLLERERLPLVEPDRYEIMEKLDNRYALAPIFFPPFETMRNRGIQTLVDVRPAGEDTAPDLFDVYEQASLNGFHIYSTRLDPGILKIS
jgi:hypothetical protein